MRDSSQKQIRDIDRVHFSEPVTIKLYGVKEISLPTYLMWYLATIVVVLILIAGSKEIMQPQTAAGESIRRSIQHEDWLLEAVSWVPSCLIAGLVFELFEGVFVLWAFRRRFRQLRVQHAARNDGVRHSE